MRVLRTSVNRDYITCTGCGATWRSLVNGWGVLMMKGATLAGFFAGFMSIDVFRSFAAAAVVCMIVWIGMVSWGANVRTRAWYR